MLASATMWTKAPIALLALVLLALDWAALDDITTGHEPSLVLEIALLALSAPLLVFLTRAWFRGDA